MFTHIMIGTNDLDRAKRFYDATLGALGIPPGQIDDNRRVFYRTAGGTFCVTLPINGELADAWHAAGLANGGTAIENPPGVREGPYSKLYLAYLRDPDGNKVCGLHRM